MTANASRPTVDLVPRADAVAVTVRIGDQSREVGSFADVPAAGEVALWLTNALYESYVAGLQAGFEAAERAISKVGDAR